MPLPDPPPRTALLIIRHPAPARHSGLQFLSVLEAGPGPRVDGKVECDALHDLLDNVLPPAKARRTPDCMTEGPGSAKDPGPSGQ